MTSEWLKVMLEEIARKREEQERARQEEVLRECEKTSAPAARPTRRD